jgi:hypothetical protein
MKSQNVRRISVIASILAAFVLYLCASLTDIVPFVLIVFMLALASVLRAKEGFAARSFVSVKLYTQKAE